MARSPNCVISWSVRIPARLRSMMNSDSEMLCASCCVIRSSRESCSGSSRTWSRSWSSSCGAWPRASSNGVSSAGSRVQHEAARRRLDVDRGGEERLCDGPRFLGPEHRFARAVEAVEPRERHPHRRERIERRRDEQQDRKHENATSHRCASTSREWDRAAPVETRLWLEEETTARISTFCAFLEMSIRAGVRTVPCLHSRAEQIGCHAAPRRFPKGRGGGHLYAHGRCWKFFPCPLGKSVRPRGQPWAPAAAFGVGPAPQGDPPRADRPCATDGESCLTEAARQRRAMHCLVNVTQRMLKCRRNWSHCWHGGRARRRGGLLHRPKRYP